MLDEFSILLQVIIINLSVSFLASFIGLRNDISNYNNKVKGKDPENETAIFTLRYYIYSA